MPPDVHMNVATAFLDASGILGEFHEIKVAQA